MTEAPTTETLNRRYVLEEQLAAGSDSQVWRARDLRMGLPVLVKHYAPAALRDWKRIQLIEREAKLLAQLRYLQIPDFVDFFTVGAGVDQSLYLVTEFVRGENLAAKLASGWQPGVDEVLNLAVQLLEMLVYLHAFEPPIVHRDIKPSNLMLGGYQRVFLIDFGGAQEQLEAQGAGGSTLVGTLGYMAPEQLAGRAEPATDLFALGVTLIELLGIKPEALPQAPGPVVLGRLLPKLQPEQCSWLARLVEADLGQRYDSAETALRDLDFLCQRDFSQRSLLLPSAQQARLPEVLRELNLVAREEDSQALLAGSLLQGRYVIESLIGAGTHSRVYRGRREQQPVILKELRMEQLGDWKQLELFEREIAIQQRLQHARIPELIEAFSISEGETVSWFLVTAAIDGESLEKQLQQGWRPSAAEVWDIAAQALEILTYLQSQNVVHRDIKPSNLMRDRAGRIWLIDFGAVQNRLMSVGGGGSTIIGTFGYMAPEQYGGGASFRSDLYGLGASLVRLLSNRHPIELSLEVQGLQFRPFVHCEPFYAAWLEHCLFPQPEARFATAAEALELLRDFTAGGKRARAWLADVERSRPSSTAPARLPENQRRLGLIPARLKLPLVRGYLRHTRLKSTETASGLSLSCPNYEAPLLEAFAASKQAEAASAATGILGISGLAIGLQVLIANEAPVSSHLPELALGLICLLMALSVAITLGHFWRIHQGQRPPIQPGTWRLKRHATGLDVSGEGLLLLAQANDRRQLNFATLQQLSFERIAWHKIKSLTLTPLKPDYPHWANFGAIRPYELRIRLRQPEPYFNGSVTSYVREQRALLPLLPEDAALLDKCLQSLHAEYDQLADFEQAPNQ